MRDLRDDDGPAGGRDAARDSLSHLEPDGRTAGLRHAGRRLEPEVARRFVDEHRGGAGGAGDVRQDGEHGLEGGAEVGIPGENARDLEEGCEIGRPGRVIPAVSHGRILQQCRNF